jgi:hypothetical protein
MQASVQPYLAEEAGTGVLPRLDVMILYEDLGTGLRAKRSLDLLPNPLPARAQLSTKLWRIGLLADPLLGEQAALEAAAADVVILSVHGRSALPDDTRAWLRRWLGHKAERPCALGVLLDPEQVSQGSDNPVIAYVQQFAAAAGVDLFYGFSQAPATELDSAMAEINERAHRATTLLEDMLQRTQSHREWGINE